MSLNSSRYDLSERLIHFFRRVDTAVDDAAPFPEDFGYSSVNEDEVLRPAFLLRHAIRSGRLWATWSERNGRRTIHGTRPAVCFTEMPIPAFIEAGRKRAQLGQAMSAYGIVIPKSIAFSLGARPVIYGLSVDAIATGGTGTPRLLPTDALPLAEQYRYVAYNPTLGTLDWTHEREWRWPLTEAPWVSPNGLPPSDADELPGFELDTPELTNLGVIVATAIEADQVVHDILTKVDRGDISRDHYAFVLAHESIQDWENLRRQDALENAISDNLIDLSDFFQQPKEHSDRLAAELDAEIAEVIKSAPSPKAGEPGGCWLWLPDSRHELVRALIATGAIKINRDGKYLVKMAAFASAGYNLQQRETLTGELAGRLRTRFGVRGDYFSVLGKQDPDEVPFYNGDQLDDDLFYNWNWDLEEFEKRRNDRS